MRGAEQGFLLLTSHLGDPKSKPLTVAQLRTLAQRMETAERENGNRELGAGDLLALGYDGEMADRILFLLSRQEQLEYYVNGAQKHNCFPITRIGANYPLSLRKKLGLDSPGCLWAKGDTGLLARPAISLVGSRQLEPDNRAFACEVGKQSARQGYVLVSGNARGADQTAQNACLDHGGQVIAIVADSLLNAEENPNVLYLSEDLYDGAFSAIRALSRNRLIHAMGEKTFVAGCRKGKGGTWNGAVRNLRHALSPLFCYQDDSDGVQALCQMGATAVTPQDLQDFSALTKKEPSLFD